jgi:GNAT superfamily N-acetyltransferase
MPPEVSVKASETVSEVDCNREERLPLDEVYLRHAGAAPDAQRGGWDCTITLYLLEDDFAQNEEVEAEVAFISYHIGDDDLCEVVDIEVADGLRGHGLGARLMEEALADMRLKGGTRVYVSAYEPDEGERTAFFEAFGFRQVDVPDGDWRATGVPFPMFMDLDLGG